jgi:hypothetical protein
MPNFIVCPACEGTGRDASTAYAITGDELNEAVGYDREDRMEYVRDLASLTQPCQCCKGQRVATPARAKEWEADYMMRAEIEQERRWGF